MRDFTPSLETRRDEIPCSRADAAPRCGAAILLADDHELARTGLRLILESVAGWRVCGEAENGAVAVELAKRLQPTIAILDVNMPVMNGLEAADRIRTVSSDALVLMVTAFDADGLSERARLSGAHRYVLKTSPATSIVATVHSMLRERERHGRPTAEPPLAPEIGKLTEREVQIVRHLAIGESNSVTGRALGITEKTVETHRANIMRKLDTESIVEIVHFAIREQLISV